MALQGLGFMEVVSQLYDQFTQDSVCRLYGNEINY